MIIAQNKNIYAGIFVYVNFKLCFCCKRICFAKIWQHNIDVAELKLTIDCKPVYISSVTLTEKESTIRKLLRSKRSGTFLATKLIIFRKLNCHYCLQKNRQNVDKNNNNFIMD